MEKLMNWVYRPMDRVWRRSMVDFGRRRPRCSPESLLLGDSGHRGSLRLKQNKEVTMVLIEVFGDRLDGEVRPATKRNERPWWCSVHGDLKPREAELGCKMELMEGGGPHGRFI
jgi:hypothetical protein